MQSILDLWASLQNSDGSWYQQYNPYSPYAVVTETSEGTDGNLKVDSGAALIAWAMSNYDRLTSGTRYKANVQHALDFLRALQYAHTVAYSSNLIANEILMEPQIRRLCLQTAGNVCFQQNLPWTLTAALY